MICPCFFLFILEWICFEEAAVRPWHFYHFIYKWIFINMYDVYILDRSSYAPYICIIKTNIWNHVDASKNGWDVMVRCILWYFNGLSNIVLSVIHTDTLKMFYGTSFTVYLKCQGSFIKLSSQKFPEPSYTKGFASGNCAHVWIYITLGVWCSEYL